MERRPIPKPRLDRRNAIKNIDYVAEQHSPSPRATRSLDFSPLHSQNKQTSFRVRGVDGEFDLICRSLGLSGPEDFAIPLAAWNASSSRSRLQNDAVSQPRVSKPVKSVRIRGLRPPPVDLNSFSPVKTRDVTSSSSDDDDDDEVETGRSQVRLVGEVNEMSSLSSSNNDSGEFGVAARVQAVHSIFSPNGKFRRSVSSSWQKGQLLGSGSYGTVYEGFTDDGFFFAVKEVSLLDQGPQGKQSLLQLEQEILLLSQFEHDNIVQYLGTDKDETKLYIFLELVTKGSLASLYSKYLLRDSQVSVFTRTTAGLTRRSQSSRASHAFGTESYMEPNRNDAVRFYSGSLMKISHNRTVYGCIILGAVLKFFRIEPKSPRPIHDRNVVHRDIKCANILIDASGSVKLADFGLAKATTFNDIKSCKGSAYWMAPEVVNRSNRGYGLAADIWSLGCAVLEMLTRQLPYSHLEGMQALFQIGSGQPPLVPDSLSKDARDFILKCLQVNPNNRPTAAELLNHSFLKIPQTSSVPASPHSNRLHS